MSEISDLLNKHLGNGAAPPEVAIETPSPNNRPAGKLVCRYCGKDDFAANHQLATHIRVDHKKEREKAKTKLDRQIDRQTIVKRMPSGARSQAADPAVRQRPGFLTAGQMIAQYGGIVKRIQKLGTAKAFKEHPEWEKTLLGRGEPRQNLYDAINRVRWNKGKRWSPEAAAAKARANHKALPVESKPKVGRPPGAVEKKKRTHWTKEQYDLAKSIMENSQFRKGNGFMNWDLAFNMHPDWAKALNFDPRSRNTFMSFVGRVRDGAKPYGYLNTKRHQEPAVVQLEPEIQVDGQSYSAEQIRKLVAFVKEHVDGCNHCPKCGYNLQKHHLAFTVAKRHSDNQG